MTKNEFSRLKAGSRVIFVGELNRRYKLRRLRIYTVIKIEKIEISCHEILNNWITIRVPEKLILLSLNLVLNNFELIQE